MRGRIRPVGGDWVSLRPDGVAILDIRGIFELEDGALVYANYSGIADLGPDGLERVSAGRPPARIQARLAARYHTGHPAYSWLNRLQCLGHAEIDMLSLSVSFDIYAVR
jgi:hypothetical protein